MGLTQKNNVENKNFTLSNCLALNMQWQVITPVGMEHKHSIKKNKKSSLEKN
jgi:hypothetical protein